MSNRSLRWILGLLITTLFCTIFSFAIAAKSEKAKLSVVLIKTNMGDIRVELNAEKAPITVANFLNYTKSGFYNGTLFHRVIPGFMIQGGGFAPGMKEKETNPPIKNEAGNRLSNKRGTIAMARTSDVNSATSQFFINLVDNNSLDHQGNSPDAFGYCVFGKVIAGMDVVDKIARVKTGTVGDFGDVPAKDVVILQVVLEK